MKTNKTMKIAVFMLALTLITSCFVGGTFAKYVTEGTGSDTARVAKFGVTVTASGTAFATEYATDNGGVVGTIAKSVVSTDKVIAPGTAGSMTATTISGTPEVAVAVTNTATVDFGEKWLVDGTYYCPITITVGETALKGTAYENIGAFEAAVKAKIDGLTANYAAGTSLATAAVPAISWSWDFEGNDDAKDTALGDAGDATLSITVKTTVTQID